MAMQYAKFDVIMFKTLKASVSPSIHTADMLTMSVCSLSTL